MSESLPLPLGGSAPPEVSLVRAPVVRVLAQVRFSSVLKIDSREGVAPLQEELRSFYPLLEQAVGQQLQLDLSSGSPALRPTASNLWRFSNSDRSLILSLSSDTVTLEARRYEGRRLFLDQWSDILRRIDQVFAPGLALRNGIRYVNRLEGGSLRQLSEMIRPNLVGVAQPELQEFVTQAFSEALTKVDEGDLILRWGILPAGATIDPGVLEPINIGSWILDIDVSNSEQKAFTGARLAIESEELAKRAYTIFRWFLTDAGHEHLGANI